MLTVSQITLLVVYSGSKHVAPNEVQGPSVPLNQGVPVQRITVTNESHISRVPYRVRGDPPAHLRRWFQYHDAQQARACAGKRRGFLPTLPPVFIFDWIQVPDSNQRGHGIASEYPYS